MLKSSSPNHYPEDNTYHHLTLQKALDSALEVEWEYLLVKGLHQTGKDAIMSIDTQGLNRQVPVGQQKLVNMISYKYGQKGHLQKDCPNASISPAGIPTASEDQQNQHAVPLWPLHSHYPLHTKCHRVLW